MRTGLESRDAWLDGLRAAAALMVFVQHAGIPGVRFTALMGFDAGVMVFFTLSGYLLYRPFLERPVDLGAYATRRLLRILPAYLVAAVGIALIRGYDLDPLGVLTMTKSTVIVAWTLQIEVVFYAALPLVARLAGPRWQPLALGAIASLGFGAIVVAANQVVPSGFLAWAWAFLPGMMVAHLSVRRPEILARANVPAVLGAGLVLMAGSIIPNLRYLDVPAAIGSALVLAWLLNRPAPRRAVGSAMVAAGAVSYSFYLWHEALVPVLDRPMSWAGMLTTFGLTTAIAAVVYVLVERPALELARRLTKPKRTELPAEPVAAGVTA